MSKSDDSTAHNRRRSLVDRHLQMKWMGYLFITAFVMMLMILFVYGATRILIQDRELLEGDDARLNSILIIAAVWIVLLGLVWFNMRASLKVIGPMYRFRQVISHVANGEIDQMEVILRKGDEFKIFADEINQMLDTLRNREERIRMISSELNNKLKILDYSLSGKEDDTGEFDRQECVRQLREYAQELLEL